MLFIESSVFLFFLYLLAGYIKDSKYGKSLTLYHSTSIFLVLDPANTNTHQSAPGLHKDHNNFLLISHIKSKTDVYKFSLLDIYNLRKIFSV